MRFADTVAASGADPADGYTEGELDPWLAGGSSTTSGPPGSRLQQLRRRSALAAWSLLPPGAQSAVEYYAGKWQRKQQRREVRLIERQLRRLPGGTR